MSHTPVLLKEVIELLNPQANENFIDCTLGFAGHAKAILERNKPKGKVLGIEWGKEKLKIQSEKLKTEQRLVVVNDSYVNLQEIVRRESFYPVNGILMDLGMSSWDLENSGRGFSFQKDEPLDMRYGVQDLTAEEIINKWPEEELARIFRDYGQERFAQNIARNAVEVRLQQPIETTFQLVEIIKKSFPRSYKFGRQHFATKVFQALRIAVNREFENLEAVLPQALEALSPGGKMAVISFHSLEDRIVKNFFRNKSKEQKLKIITKKPITPLFEEIKNNPRSRSAKLRLAQKL
ncbi:MAG: 16S rRNA (cytosine(1402)-N(4))-methyltransferase RsmH [Patescibacteria group bacterium]|nr:16S rRNA (cytosine(1402)-N(4))-methyltransferase RsmH [Patescibacteria group bacterium]